MLAKVVVSRGQQRTSSVTPEEAFANLCQMHPNALVYLMHHPEEGTWCGATPELLLRAQQHDVDTVSLAGTRRTPSVAWTDKERVEQQLVTDHILDVLAQKGPPTLRLTGRKTRPTANSFTSKHASRPPAEATCTTWPKPCTPRPPCADSRSKRRPHSFAAKNPTTGCTTPGSWGGPPHSAAPTT